ncbi:unnamed protein product, partial [Arabidopsis halleri]
LKTFGFRKVDDSEQEWEYANEDFVRGKPELTLDIEITYEIEKFCHRTTLAFMFKGLLPEAASPE